jgi:hypothetical protein
MGTMSGSEPLGHHLPWRMMGETPINMNGRLTAVSGTIKQTAPIERTIEAFDCRDLTTKNV